MSRLTKKYPNGFVTIDADNYTETQETIDSAVRNSVPVMEAVKILAEYEDAEEGRLPYKPGDVVWTIDNNMYNEAISISGYIFMAECMGYAILTIEYYDCVDFEEQMALMAENKRYEDFAELIIIPMERVFLTREEAEQALKDR